MLEKEKVTKAAGIVGASTLLSRIFGFARDIILAAFFGAGLHSDAFIAAFRIPNLLRRLFAEGTLVIAFVPVFTQYLDQRENKEAFDLARSAMIVLFSILLIITILGIIFSPFIVKMIAFGFKDRIEQYELTVLLTRIMFPYSLLICLVALCMGILNTLGHFAAPAVAPVLLNIAMIVSVLLVSLVSSDMTVRIIGLSCGVIAGGILQLGLQVPYLIRTGFTFFKKSVLIHPGLKKIGLLMMPAILGAGVYQINMLIGTFLASLLPTGSISYLYYADRLVQFPLGIFAIAVATAVLPSLSRHAANQDLKGLKNTFAYSLKLILFIMLPSVAGLIVLSEPIISLLLERGEFDQYAVKMTSQALLYYCSGIWATAGGCHFHPYKYFCLCYSDGTHETWWSCTGNIHCIYDQSDDTDLYAAEKTGSPGLAEYSIFNRKIGHHLFDNGFYSMADSDSYHTHWAGESYNPFYFFAYLYDYRSVILYRAFIFIEK